MPEFPGWSIALVRTVTLLCGSVRCRIVDSKATSAKKKFGSVFTIVGTGPERSFEGTAIRLGLDGDTLLPGPPIGENIVRQ
jgi:hypothetical protein